MQSGYHIRACCAEIPGLMKIVRDDMGNTTSMEGLSVEMLNWMISAYNFTYECVNVYMPTLENTSTTVGGIHYVMTDVCDVVIAPNILRYDRFQWLDFLHSWLIEPVVLMLIPMPVFVSDSSAFLKPFSLPVWVLILFSILAITAMLIILDYIKGPPGSGRSKIHLHWLFVIGSLFGQGGFWASSKTRIRILMAVWLFGTFILVGFYTSQLFGYLMTSIPKQIVKSVEELADKPNVDLLVQDNVAIDILISKSDDPLMKKLAKKINLKPKESRCPNVPACMERAKEINKHASAVFIHGLGPISNVMMKDFRKTGKCNFALAQKNFNNGYHGSWMVRKGDLNTESYNMATLRLNEAGLLNHWQDVYQPTPYQCLDMSKPKKNDPRSADKLSLQNLGIPFAMLLVGFVLAFVVLILEKWLAAFGFKKVQQNRSYISAGLVL